MTCQYSSLRLTRSLPLGFPQIAMTLLFLSPLKVLFVYVSVSFPCRQRREAFQLRLGGCDKVLQFRWTLSLAARKLTHGRENLLMRSDPAFSQWPPDKAYARHTLATRGPSGEAAVQAAEQSGLSQRPRIAGECANLLWKISGGE